MREKRIYADAGHWVFRGCVLFYDADAINDYVGLYPSHNLAHAFQVLGGDASQRTRLVEDAEALVEICWATEGDKGVESWREGLPKLMAQHATPAQDQSFHPFILSPQPASASDPLTLGRS